MGYFLNSIDKINQFTKETKGKYFVDKSKMIERINKKIDTTYRFICITKPRRFGKSTNLMMLASYYSKGVDFKDVFDELEISKSETYLEHLNKHNVIYINFSEVPEKVDFTYEEYMDNFVEDLVDDLIEANPELKIDRNKPLYKIFDLIYDKTEKGFIFMIDEWDYIFSRNLFTQRAREAFLDFLMNLFKDQAYVDLVYMTGILPIAKYSEGSSLNMFDEYSVIGDGIYDRYFGFTEDEVEELCKKQNELSMDELKDWYKGYKTYDGEDYVYNPWSVRCALEDGVCRGYWIDAGPMDELLEYLTTDITWAEEDIIKMMSGIEVGMRLSEYTAEKVPPVIESQLFSAMANYGFLNYYNYEVRIPNMEIQSKFDSTIQYESVGEIAKLIRDSKGMLEATLKKDINRMEEIIQAAYDFNIPLLNYDKNSAFSCLITLIYLPARHYYKIIREETVSGQADFVFHPYDRSQPAFILELKKDSTPEDAIRQIKERRYVEALSDCTGEKFAVGIVYDSKNKNHKIKIENL